jgi:hypothetical protein
LTVIEPDAESRPVLVIPVFKLANICGFQGPARNADCRGLRRAGLSKLNSVQRAGPREGRRVGPGSVDMLGGLPA